MPPPRLSNLSQFNLRTMFVATAVLALVFAAARYGGWAGLFFAATFAVLIAGHVLGNVLGTRLRDEVSPQWNPRPHTLTPQIDRTSSRTVQRSLHERTPLGRIIHVITAGAAAVGAILGGLALRYWTGVGAAGWIVGTVSSAVLGGFVGFLLASFLEMTIRAWWQAAGKTGDATRPKPERSSEDVG